MKVCKERDYHTWSTSQYVAGHQEVDSIEEDYEKMTLTAQCSEIDCDATWEGSGDWDNEEEDK